MDCADKIVRFLQSTDRQRILGGDFNVDADEMEATCKCLKWKAVVKATAQDDHTRLTASAKPSRIDYFLTSPVFGELMTKVANPQSR